MGSKEAPPFFLCVSKGVEMYKYLFLLCFLCVSCSTPIVHQELNPNIIYKRDIYLKVNDSEGIGTLVVPRSNKYNYHIKAKGTLDLFTLNTCHREWTKEKAWNVTTKKKIFLGWSKKVIKDHEMTFTYTPVAIEQKWSCITELGGYDKVTGQHSWGMIDYETPEAIVPAVVECNGVKTKSNGVALCQAKVGLIQALTFNEEMAVSPSKGCELPKTRGTYFEFPIKKGRCVYAFMTAAKPHAISRVTTFGYESVLIRMD